MKVEDLQAKQAEQAEANLRADVAHRLPGEHEQFVAVRNQTLASPTPVPDPPTGFKPVEKTITVRFVTGPKAGQTQTVTRDQTIEMMLATGAIEIVQPPKFTDDPIVWSVVKLVNPKTGEEHFAITGKARRETFTYAGPPERADQQTFYAGGRAQHITADVIAQYKRLYKPGYEPTATFGNEANETMKGQIAATVHTLKEKIIDRLTS